MPAALDLTGHRYGKLTVLAPAGTMQFGRKCSAWLCRCDCGVEFVAPILRLRTKSARHLIAACEACRARPCIICDTPIFPPSTSATCSIPCAADHQRSKWRVNYYRYSSDPEWRADTNRKRSALFATLPEDAKKKINRKKYRKTISAIGHDGVASRSRESHAARMRDPEYREKRRLKSQAWRIANLEKCREYQRKYAQKRRAAAAVREVTLMIGDTDDN